MWQDVIFISTCKAEVIINSFKNVLLLLVCFLFFHLNRQWMRWYGTDSPTCLHNCVVLWCKNTAGHEIHQWRLMDGAATNNYTDWLWCNKYVCAMSGVKLGKHNREPAPPSSVYLKNYNLSDISIHILFSYLCSSEWMCLPVCVRVSECMFVSTSPAPGCCVT